MKIEKSKSKKVVSDLPAVTKELVQRLLTCSEQELAKELKSVQTWRYGKCELYHWIDVLDRFDGILSDVTQHDSTSSVFMCPRLADPKVKELTVSVINFTAVLIEHSYARHIYNSTEHLCTLLGSPDLDVVLVVLNLLYVFGKRSNFISRLPSQQRNTLNSFLEYLGESWGGEQNGFGLSKCCQDTPLDQFPLTATSVYFQYQPAAETEPQHSGSHELHVHFSAEHSRGTSSTCSISLSSVDKMQEDVAELMRQQCSDHHIPLTQQMRLLSRLRLAKSFSNYHQRVMCVLVRLQAICVLVYSVAPPEVVDPLVYDGFVDELVEVLEQKASTDDQQAVRAAALRTLTAIIHLERDPRLGSIIEATGAATYHGFLPTLVRNCVVAITKAGTNSSGNTFPLPFATALFSFLYHLATYEASGDALVNSGVMESLLQVLEWRAHHPAKITLVTRAVRVIDLITNLDMTAFHSLGGWSKMLKRLELEVAECRRDVPNMLSTSLSSPAAPMDTSETHQSTSDTHNQEGQWSGGGASAEMESADGEGGEKAEQCIPELAALIKSILNFLKKAIPDPMFAESIRNLVDSSLTHSLAHIASNAEYYGPSVYLPATEVTTTFIFHEPSQLSALQDNGLPWIILNSLVNKKIPVTREVLSALPTILSALCLNARGLTVFIDADPFDHLFGILISEDYLPAMRRKRGNDQLSDTASNLGAAMDELMRHQPLLRDSVMAALIRLLKQLSVMGSTPSSSPPTVTTTKASSSHAPKASAPAGESMTSDSENEEYDEFVRESTEDKSNSRDEDEPEKTKTNKTTPPPLTEFVLNVIHFVDAILSNNSTDDHIKVFITHGGLQPLLSLLSLPALPLDFPSSSTCSAITFTCRSILNIAHEGKLLDEALIQIQAVLSELGPIIKSPEEAKGSIMLQELEKSPSSTPSSSPLLCRLTAMGAYIQLFIHLLKSGQFDSRQLCVKHWSSEKGLNVLTQLSSIYRALVWECFAVLAVVHELGQNCQDGQEKKTESGSEGDKLSSDTNGPSTAGLVAAKLSEAMNSKAYGQVLKRHAPLLWVATRVGSSLAELMSMLVQVCTGPVHRALRRGAGLTHQHPSEEAIAVCRKVTDLLVDSLMWVVPMPRSGPMTDTYMWEWLFSGMTFKMYAVDFCLLLLFDEQQQAYHLMLHIFDEKNLLDCLTSSFREALKDQKDDGSTSSFLEAWLNLAEKLINATAILDSAHSLSVLTPRKLTFNPMFNPIQFIIKAQRAILPCIEQLWESLHTNHHWVLPEVVEHLVTTFRHFYTSEKVIKQRLKEFSKEEEKDSKTKPSTARQPSAQSTGPPPAHPPPPPPPPAPGGGSQLDHLYLQLIIDMGFSREHAEQALVSCNNDLAAATEWILTHPLPSSIAAAPSASSATATQPSALSAGLSEEEQIARAIALSLGQAGSSSQSKKPDETAEKVEKVEEKPKEEKVVELAPIDESVLDSLSDKLLEGTLRVVSQVRDTVYSACDLITALSKRNGPQWREKAISRVKDEAVKAMRHLTTALTEGSYVLVGGVLDPHAFHVCLLALIMDEMPLACAPVVCQSEVLTCCVELLTVAQSKLPDVKKERSTPLWLSPLLLVLEFWEGMAALTKWQKPPAKNTRYVWLSVENMNGRWCCFSAENAKLLETAYQEGESSVRMVSSRQKLIVRFGPMIQINVETGTQRPVLRLEVPKKKEEGASTTTQDSEEQQSSHFTLPCRLSKDQALSTTVVRCCTRLLSTDIDTEAIHATMRLLLRLTRSPSLAVLFVEEGGPQSLLSLTHKSHFVGFTSLCSLLFRHVLEEGDLLQQAVETMVRTVISGTSSSVSREFKIHGPACRDFDYVLRFLSPCAYRNDKLFFDTAVKVVRLVNLPPKPEDYVGNSKLPLTPLKYVGPLHPNTSPLSPTQKNLISLLIDQLCTTSSSEETPSDANITIQPKIDEETTDSALSRQPGLRIRSYPRMSTGGRARRNSYRRQLAGNDDDDDLRSEDMVLDNEPTADSDRTPQNMSSSSNGVDQSAGPDQETAESTKEAGENEKQQKRLLFSQAAILRLLAELIESYPACGCMIVGSTKKIKLPASSHQDTKEVSILAYVLDNLLPASYTQGSSASQVAKLSKTFVQCLASASLPTDILTTFANEYRSALSRTLALPESQYKHYRVRALAGLTAQIVEPQGGMTTRSISNPSQFVRMLIRKGFITDLAKAVYSLDLSSPMLITTVNTLLKPMESLTKIVSHFVAAQKRAAMVSNKQGGEGAGASDQQASSSSSRDRPQGRPQGGSAARVGEEPSDQSSQAAASQAAGPSRANQSSTPHEMSSSVLGAVDDSLIPLQPEEDVEEQDQIPGGPPPELLQEAMSLAFNIGRRIMDDNAGDHPADMDIDDIVDELLERDPTVHAQGAAPAAILDVLETSNPRESDVSSILSHSDEDDDMEPDNYNSAGEEIEDEEFDESRVAYTVPPREVEVVDHISDVDSHTSSDEADQGEEEEEEGMALDGDSDQDDEHDDEEEEEERESFNLTAEEEEGNDTYDLAEEEEEEDLDEDEDELDDDDDDELNFETYEEGAMDAEHDYVHVSFPWELGWHDMHPLEHHYYAGPMAINSPLGRAYHLRTPGSLELDLSPSSRPQLPQQHPLLLRGARQGGAGPVGAQHSDGMPRDNIVQQMLTNISSWVGSEEVLSLNMGGGTPPRTNVAIRGSEAYVSTMSPDEDMESTIIPDLLSRWREESQALDRYAANRCIAALRNKLLNKLVEIHNAEAELKKTENKEKAQSSSAQPKSTTSHDIETPVAPNPSDEATPLVATPRTTSSSVEQLQSSLRAVADALAQTVVQVRSARHLMEIGSREDSDTLASTREREEGQESGSDQLTDNAPVAQPSTPQVLSSAQSQSSATSSPSTGVRGVRSLPDLSNFDGTQESARSILANTSRNDPLYIFLSAIAGAPAPPLPEPTELTQTPPISQSASSPRLPVFTQLQNSNAESPSALPVSVIQDHRTTPPSQTSVNSSVPATAAPSSNQSTTNPPPHSPSVTSEQPHSQAPQSLESVPSHVSQSVLAAGNLADVLAVELTRAISTHMPTPADGSSALPSADPRQAPTPAQPIHAQDQTNQTLTSSSSSPSDTLAPLLTSLQMPPPHSQDAAAQGREEEVSSNPSTSTAAEMQVDTSVSESSNQSVVVETSQSSQTGSVESASTGQISSAETGTSQTSSATTSGTQTSSANTDTGQTTGASGTGQSSQASSSQTRGAGSSEEGFPEEIDPTFLAALPDVIRQEVLAQFEREQRLRQQQRQQQDPPQQQPQQQQQQLANVSPDFLAALPLDIQEEVLQQQRWERARQVSQSIDPALPTDAGNFLQSLPLELRRTILSDVDDTVINQLPDNIAQEARALQEERLARRRWLEEERLAMRQSLYEGGRVPPWGGGHPLDPALRYAVLNLNSRDIGRMRDEGLSAIFSHAANQMGVGTSNQSSSKQMLDQEGLCCLLVFLFLDQSKLHFNRLFRIFRSLCQHLPTRAWLLSSLFAILSTANEPPMSHTCPAPPPLTPSRSSTHPKPAVCSTPIPSHDHPTHWLNMTINAALGSHAPMFQFNQVVGKSLTPTTVRIHPHASTIICNNVLDLLVFLARQFPSAFLPVDLLPKETRNLSHLRLQPSATLSNFWQLLLRLDNSTSKKGKGSNKSFTVPETTTEMSEADLFACSPFGQLMGLFSHRIIQNSLPLVDKLIRALSVIAGTIPKQGLARREKAPDASVPKETDAKDKDCNNAAYSIYESCTDIGRSLSGSLVSVELLQSAVSLLISGKCSEDCLEDATTFLINLSRCSGATRDTILFILLAGVQKIGQVLGSQIKCLLSDIVTNLPKIANRRQSSIPSSDDTEEPMATSSSTATNSSSASNSSSAAPSLGSVTGVVLPTLTGARPTVDHSHDLHLPSMMPLTGKVSQQSFFLRLLKVICQLREAAMLFSCKTTPIPGAFLDTDPPASSFLARIMTPLSSALLPSVSNNDDAAGNQNEPGASQNEPGASQNEPGASQNEPEANQNEPGASQSEPAAASQSEAGATAASTSKTEPTASNQFSLPPLSKQLDLEILWGMLSECLDALEKTYDPHAVLVLQPTVEAFFLVHGDSNEESKATSTAERKSQHNPRSRRLPSFHTISDTDSLPGSPAPFAEFSPVPGTPSTVDMEASDPYAHLPPDTARFLKFADRHRTVLNQILRQSTVPLSEGPFAVLVNHTRLLDFDVKRRYFRQELEQMDEGMRREDLVVHVRRDHVFEDSFRELYRRSPEEMKANLYITFEGEEGQDAGGLIREWYLIIAREMFNPNYVLFKTTPGDRVTYMPNSSSHINPNHLNYFKFIGRIIAKAIYDNKLLDCYFTRSFYKHILGKPVHYTDMEAEDYAFYQGMVYLLTHDLNEIGTELNFTTEIEEFGQMVLKELKANGQNLAVTESNKREFVQLACQMKMTGSIRSQIKSFLEGFYEVIPKNLISIFNEQELELLVSGLPTIDIDDLKGNTEYHKYNPTSLQIQWFWRALRSFDQADRARFLQFVTGTSKVPLQGFVALEGMNGIQKFQIHRDDRSTERLPCAHTCFNQLDLPPYETYDKLHQMLLTAIRECPEGFGFA